MHLSVLFPRPERLPSEEEMAVESCRSFHVFHLAPSVFRLSSQLRIEQKKALLRPHSCNPQTGSSFGTRSLIFPHGPFLSLVCL